MVSRCSLYGHYLGGQFVLVRSEEQKSKQALDLLGHFGTNLENATRKDTSRRGPGDRQLANLDIGTASQASATILTLHEAFFLLHGLNLLTIQAESSDVLDTGSCWNLFREYHRKSNIHQDFAIEYGVYHYFRSRGWIVKSGENYGTNFLLYRGSPSVDHAQYAVLIIYENDARESNIHNWDSLLTYHRVIRSVSKDLLIAFVVTSDGIESKFNNPDSINKLSIMLRLFSGSSNTIERKTDEKSVYDLDTVITQ